MGFPKNLVKWLTRLFVMKPETICIEEEKCKTKPKKDCKMKHKQKCIPYPKKECKKVPREKCKDVEKKHCEPVWKQICHKIPGKKCMKEEVIRQREVCTPPPVTGIVEHSW